MLGRGGFGVTFLAKDIVLPGQPLCVIKQLCVKYHNASALKNARDRFKREAKTLSLLGNHSQIPLLLDYFVNKGEFYLVQEYISGITLARLVRRQGCQSENTVKTFLQNILPVLAYIHQQGVIHRDIKPQNLIYCQNDQRLVLIDFGAVKQQITIPGQTSLKASTTNFIGTIGFASPEQFSLRPVYASDLYSLGITCLYLLTAKAPLDFESDRHTGLLQWKHLVQVSQPFADILEKMLQPALKDRYNSANSVLKDLNRQPISENLFDCLNVQSRPQEDIILETPAQYIPYSVRMGKAIREWKAHLKAKEIQNSTE
jgi:serine/threonine-protein kinase